MKKTLKFTLVALMLFALTLTMAGCGEKENDQVKFARGEWVENQYQNEFAKIKFNLPEGWEKSTDEQIAELMNVGTELLNEDQQKLVELAEKTTVYGMQASNPSDGSSIMITFEKPILKVTPEYYLSNVKTQLEALQEMSYTIGEQYTKSIAGTDYLAIDASIEGYDIKQSYFVRAEGDYIVGIIVTTTQEGELDEVLNCFE